MPKILLWTVLFGFTIISPFIGTANLDLNTLLESSSLSQRIFLELRLPRILLA
ncbi:MAG TPA: iron ABC transporter permease, partial [Sulfurimonas sp.]|nr:iron ABC transporter permease [Sulfurimonas sp.]